MARARNIKPSFFTNDELGDVNPLARLLFIGMWTIADFKGCFEYKPKRLKVQLLPYDDCDIEELVTDLEKSGFISKYTVQGRQYIKALNFTKHQNPHKNERESGSEIPDIDQADQELSKNNFNISNLPNIENNLEQDGTDRADSLNLIPDSLNLIPEVISDVVENSASPKRKPKTQKTTVPENFEISEQVRIWATSKNFGDLEQHLEYFVSKAAANGYKYADWDAAFKTAIRDDWAKLRTPRYPNQGYQSAAQQTANEQAKWDNFLNGDSRFVDVTPKKSLMIEEVGHA
ncbi:hypothetical protein ACIN5021_2848 [Acinetobacter sp. OIFC021]|uniref:hypothetical protein n=1 Tax=Acinetobacter calcoaceticus/baumannii complex TaxID=909768 RepID=UPI0002AEDB94|nr:MULTISPECIES: hypothetical protein [Acinetobacter calcoaceticus/baumannii complex]ELW79447.1 hypothetical protein ACIN5021_2848 [Acinetobacter sp. OIFC021]MBJ9961435.1 hypothetical protein [Acinetobacter nosocomialis]HAI55318.1 hypothetical protein [Acinetobacter nosocomialis]